MSLDSRLVACIISSLVVVKYNKLPIKLLNVDASVFFLSNFLL
jgi:hypothetical protein